MTDLLKDLEAVALLAGKATPGEWGCYTGGKRATVHSTKGHVAFFSQRTFGARGEGPVTTDEMISNVRLTASLVNLFRTHHAEIAEAVRVNRAVREVVENWRVLARVNGSKVDRYAFKFFADQIDAAIDAHNSAREDGE